MSIRIGTGYDIHQLVPDRKLILGGIEIEYELGLLGHSDADVLIHAIIDALLGAAALGDIGTHFPDTDSKYKDADSAVLLNKTAVLLREAGYEIANIDSSLICQKPKLAPYIMSMRQNIADILGIDISEISIKAKTNEKLDSVGRGEAIAVHTAALITK